MISKRARLESLLPATPVTQEMRKQIEDVAGESGVSMAEVQRQAIAFFLAEFANSVSKHDGNFSTEKAS